MKKRRRHGGRRAGAGRPSKKVSHRTGPRRTLTLGPGPPMDRLDGAVRSTGMTRIAVVRAALMSADLGTTICVRCEKKLLVSTAELCAMPGHTTPQSACHLCYDCWNKYGICERTKET